MVEHVEYKLQEQCSSVFRIFW